MEEKLLVLINHNWTSPAMDAVMAAMSSLRFWTAPLLVIVLFIIVRGSFRARAMLVVLALGVLVSDCVISDTLKHVVKRPRPNEVVAGVRIVSMNLHHLSTKGPQIVITSSRPDPSTVQGRSFPSSHTMNNFCAAVILSYFYRRFGWLYFIPATLISYSRIYVGSHWPSDVAISMIMGIGAALLLLAFCEWLWSRAAPKVCPRLFEAHPRLCETAAS